MDGFVALMAIAGLVAGGAVGGAFDAIGGELLVTGMGGGLLTRAITLGPTSSPVTTAFVIPLDGGIGGDAIDLSILLASFFASAGVSLARCQPPVFGSSGLADGMAGGLWPLGGMGLGGVVTVLAATALLAGSGMISVVVALRLPAAS